MKIAIIGAGNVGGDVAQAAGQAEIVVLAVPFAASAEAVSRAIAGQVKGKIVIDATNPLKPDMSGLATEGGASGAERIQQWLPGARVIKAFNTVFAPNQAEPVVEGQPVDGFVAGDDDSARETVLRLLAEMGFRPIDVGALARARELEALAYLNIMLQVTKQGSWRSASKLLDPPPGALKVAAAQSGSRARH